MHRAAPAGGTAGFHGELSHVGGLRGLILFGFLEAACIPIPSEITFGFAGVLAYQGHLNLALVIIVGSLAELAGSYVSYAVGRAGGRPLVHRLGRYVLVTESDVNRAERFLEGRGSWAIPVGRILPLIRGFTSIVAGLVRVPAIRFGILSLIGTVIYAAALSSIGYAVGSAWQSVSHGLAVVGYVLSGLVVIAMGGFVSASPASVPPTSRAGALPGAQVVGEEPVRCRGLRGHRRRGTRFRELPRGRVRPG